MGQMAFHLPAPYTICRSIPALPPALELDATCRTAILTRRFIDDNDAKFGQYSSRSEKVVQVAFPLFRS